ncbi:cold-shock protein [Kutzneria viridogrisea]|uniref:CSD domain-containing protein n=2 Tax=Kutzneria TaxID=43356 RepID=W5WCS7_9PSEU|nr:cold shock domain-containing protein [Kutzneria albida]AHH98366.1 hypothetical protein KALB_5004 [Kutzneria albida DSM 43870]MBA8924116.1 cold shock CspA family protein [Kutzneria viridogrisea]
MAVGTVKWFKPGKGYGVIKQEDGNEVLVNSETPLRDGARVSFELVDNQGMQVASNVQPA